MCGKSLKDYAMIPFDMQIYLRNHGRSFSKKACEYAVSMMKRKNKMNGNLEKVEYIPKEKVEDMLKKNGVVLERNIGYNAVYVANMIKSDKWNSSVEDELHWSRAIKDEIDDCDTCTDSIFNCWITKMEDNGMPIPWSDIL